MTAPDERFTITLPDTWTPEQALAIFELLNDVTDEFHLWKATLTITYQVDNYELVL